jgi:hypothetical protein
MNRKKFLKKLVQLILFSVLVIIALVLGRKTVSGSDCKSCPGKGICNGEIDCSKFLAGERKEK